MTKTISKDTPLAEITLRRYEKPSNLSGRELTRKLCLSIGLLQPGDSRDVMVDVLDVLINNKKEMTSKEIEKVEMGDIIVVGMTRPHLIVACRKAAAIITDEGGILCHAAIVSRELKIPCVIGTRVGTKVLKDNDLVEVDADKGIVKIVKRN